MGATEHRIGRLVFDLTAPDEDALDGFNLLLRNRFDSTILPALEAAFDRIDRPGELIRFDRMEIDLGEFDPAAMDDAELTRRMVDHLAAALADPAAASGGSRGRDDTAELLAFLETGELAWAEPGKALAALSASLLALDPDGMNRLAARLRALLIRRSAAERLVRQLPAALVRRLFRALLPEGMAVPLGAAFGNDARISAPSTTPVPEALVGALAETIRTLADGSRMPELGEVVGLYAALDGHAAATAVPFRHAAMESVPTGPTTLENQPAKAPEPRTQSMTRPLHAAGAVLLHPFLGTFFDRLGLLDGPGRFRDHRAHGRAVLLAHLLATGADEAPEPETLLFKLLCGMPFAEPLPRRIEPSKQEREETDTLLANVIGHWQRLGNTSPAGLREGFLTRPGRLEQRGETWLLRVEPRGIDVLLNDLPWTLSRVRTPFMSFVLSVDWR